MEEEVRFPPLEGGVVEGVITYWHFEEGDEVEEFDDLIEISSAESTYSVPSSISGILVERCVQEGDKVKVGDNLAIMDTKN